MPRKVVGLAGVLLAGAALAGLYMGLSAQIAHGPEEVHAAALVPNNQALGVATDARPLDPAAAFETPPPPDEKADVQTDDAPKAAAPKTVAVAEAVKAPNSSDDAIGDILAAPQEPAAPAAPPRPADAAQSLY